MNRWRIVLGFIVAAASVGCGHVSRTDNACQECAAGGSAATAGHATSDKPSKGKPGLAAGGTSGVSVSEPNGAGSGGGAAAPSVSAFAPQCDEPLEFKSECSFEDTCQVLGCGDGFSWFGDDGCRRACAQSSECGDGQRCRFTILATDCGGGSVVEGCSYEPDGSCVCGTSDDCSFPDICVDEARYPSSEDCVVEGASCDDLLARQQRLDTPFTDISLEKSKAIDACLRAIHQQRVALSCPGTFAPECSEPLEFVSQCSFEDTCTALGCGNGVSEFGADGCRRLCTTSADCGAGERCRHTALVTNEDECITGGDFDACYYSDGSCYCSQNASCEFPDVCVDATKYPPSQDCVLEGASCRALAFLKGSVDGFLQQPTPDADDVAFATACLQSVKDKQAALGCVD